MTAAAPLPAPADLPVVAELPDLFTLADAGRVRTRGDWERRRAELRGLALHYEYGPLPPEPGPVSARPVRSRRDRRTGTLERTVHLRMGPGRRLSTHLRLTVPPGDGPFPAIISGDLNWDGALPARVSEVARRGYVLAEFNRVEIAPDSRDRAGVYSVFAGYDGGRLAAWAWGFHRVVDYLRTLGWVDGERIAVTGHSRGGKAALLAGATDERIALTAPNNSGCGGAGCFRVQGEGSEDIAAIVRAFPYWFHPRLAGFVGQVERLPFDQHALKAMVAPRALLSTEALGDLWANPRGTQQTHLAAREAFAFLGVPDRVGIRFRPGVHEQNEEDWRALLDFADHVLRGKLLARDFGQLAFPADPRAYSWRAPLA